MCPEGGDVQIAHMGWKKENIEYIDIEDRVFICMFLCFLMLWFRSFTDCG